MPMRQRPLGVVTILLALWVLSAAAPAPAATATFSDLFPGESMTRITSLDGGLLTQINGGRRFEQNSLTGITDVGTVSDGSGYRVTVLTPSQALQGFQQTANGYPDVGSESLTLESASNDPISIPIGVSSVSGSLPSRNGVAISKSMAPGGLKVQAMQTLDSMSVISSGSLGSPDGGGIEHTYTRVPVPAAVVLLGTGLIGLVTIGWRRTSGSQAA